HRQSNTKGRSVSVYKNKDGRSPYFHYDFQVRGHRFHGSTKRTTRREAEKVEAAKREKAKRLVTQLAAAKTSLRLDDVADRYWQETRMCRISPSGFSLESLPRGGVPMDNLRRWQRAALEECSEPAPVEPAPAKVGQHHAGADNTEHDLALLIEFFGKDQLVTDITDDEVTRLVAWRHGHRRKDSALISPYTV